MSTFWICIPSQRARLRSRFGAAAHRHKHGRFEDDALMLQMRTRGQPYLCLLMSRSRAAGVLQAGESHADEAGRVAKGVGVLRLGETLPRLWKAALSTGSPRTPVRSLARLAVLLNVAGAAKLGPRPRARASKSRRKPLRKPPTGNRPAKKPPPRPAPRPHLHSPPPPQVPAVHS